MPVVTVATGTLASNVTKRCRAILNDMLNGDSSGDIFADDVPYVVEFVNDAIDYVGNKLLDADVEICTNTGFILNVPPCAFPADPNAQVYVGYTGTNNGNTNFPIPILPVDLMIPLKIESRQSGTNNPYILISHAGDGLGVRGLQIFQNVKWDWYGNTLYLNGSNIPMDLRVKYLIQLPNITTLNEYIPIPNAVKALAYAAVAAYETSRGNPLAAAFLNESDKAIATIINRTQREKQRVSYRRRWQG